MLKLKLLFCFKAYKFELIIYFHKIMKKLNKCILIPFKLFHKMCRFQII